MRPLTETIPKPLIEVCGTPILDHIIQALPAVIDELVLVVGYRQEQIRTYCGELHLGKKITYVEQADFAGGTGDALMCAKEAVTGKFLFMYADDIHGAPALATVVAEDHAMLGMYSETPELFGVLEQNEDGTLKAIVEKPAEPTSDLVNIGGFVVDPSIFSYEVAVSAEHDELLVTDMLTAYAVDHPVKIIAQETWLPIGYPEHIAAAEAVLCPDYVDKTA